MAHHQQPSGAIISASDQSACIHDVERTASTGGTSLEGGSKIEIHMSSNMDVQVHQRSPPPHRDSSPSGHYDIGSDQPVALLNSVASYYELLRSCSSARWAE